MAERIPECAFWAAVIAILIAVTCYSVHSALAALAIGTYRRLFSDHTQGQELTPYENERFQETLNENLAVHGLQMLYLWLFIPTVLFQLEILRRKFANANNGAIVMNCIGWFVLLFIGSCAHAWLFLK